MPNGYVRQSAADITPLTGVRSAPLNAEFNALQSAFDATNGHSHDGTPGGGAPISKFLLGTSSLTAPAGAIAGDTNTGIGQIGGADTISLIAGGSEGLRVTAVTGGVNYTRFYGATGGNAPVLMADGSDPNISMAFLTKGTGNHIFYTAASLPQAVVLHTANANRYLTLTGSANGNPTIGSSAGGISLLPANGQVNHVSSGDTLLQYFLSNSNRIWSLSNYSTAQTGLAGLFAVADETAGKVRMAIDTTGTVSVAGGPGYESLRVPTITGANRAVLVSGSNGGNPSISTSAGGLDLRSTDGTVLLGGGQTGATPNSVVISETGHATSKRASLLFGSNWIMGQDFATSGVKDFFLYCVGLASNVLSIATSGVVSFFKAVRGSITTLTDGATITPDFNASNYFTVTLAGNRTLANPTNLAAGQGGSIIIRQDGTGSRTLSFGSYFKFPGGTVPSLSTSPNAVDRLVYFVASATEIHAVLFKDIR